MYTISYHLDEGSMQDNPTSYTADNLPITLKNPIRSGYTFIGWTGSNGSAPQTELVIGEGTTGNLNYIANWKADNTTGSDQPTTPETVSLI